MNRLLPIFLIPAAFAALTSTSALADCTCRAQGRMFEQGQAVCLATPNGLRVATCGMVLNNSAWEFSQTPCVTSQRLPQRPAVPHDHNNKNKS
jgi:hypothetical protein